MKKIKKYDGEQGFTLVEVLVSMAILGIIVVGFLPILIHGVHNGAYGKDKLVATRLASSQIEWLKTQEYENVGIDKEGYKPHGIVDPDLYMNQEDSNPLIIDGIEYKVRTKIYWNTENTSIDQSEVLTASKKVDVTVYANNPITNKEKDFSVLGTIITYEGERTDPNSFGLRVFVNWLSNEPTKNVLIKAEGPSTQYAYTDSQGLALIADENFVKGDYTITPIQWDLGHMTVKPIETGDKGLYKVKIDGKERWNTSQVGAISEHFKPFFVDYPARIQLLNEQLPEQAILMIKPSNESYPLQEGQTDEEITLNINLSDLSTTDFWWNWIYDYIVKKNDDIYFLTNPEENKEWDGTFEQPSRKPMTKELKLNFGMYPEGDIYTNGEFKVITLTFSAPLSEIENAMFQFGENTNFYLDSSFGKMGSLEELEELASSKLIQTGYYLENITSKQIAIFIYDPNNLLGIDSLENKITIVNPEDIKTYDGIELAPDRNIAVLKSKD